jgi:hypothetical protein
VYFFISTEQVTIIQLVTIMLIYKVLQHQDESFLLTCIVIHLQFNINDRHISLRDRPGGGLWFFASFRIFFSDNTRVRIFIFFVQNSTLGYMTNTLNQIFFFPPPKSEYFFQQHWESEYFFRKIKLKGRSLILI